MKAIADQYNESNKPKSIDDACIVPIVAVKLDKEYTVGYAAKVIL